MSTYANGDTGSDRAYDYEAQVRDAAIDAKNEWIRENGPFETEDEADDAYYAAKAEWEAETQYWDAYGESLLAQWDDDPNPYLGTYSEE